MQDYILNARAQYSIDEAIDMADELKVDVHELENGARVLDFGIDAPGGLDAGVMLASLCLANLGDVFVSSVSLGDKLWPHVNVSTDHPTTACLLSQYAGWKIATDDYFAMGSGPMRASAAVEELFDQLNYREEADTVVGVLESNQLPTDSAVNFISEKTGVPTENITLAVAPTASLAGTLQVVARSVETSLHKLFELGFDVSRIQSASGLAPLAPVAKDDLTGIGWTNDAILYGGRVHLWVTGDDESLEQIGPQVPANSSEKFGSPFLEIFEEVGRDFYQIDPHLFSPAEVTFQNVDTGKVHRFGEIRVDVLDQSYGW